MRGLIRIVGIPGIMLLAFAGAVASLLGGDPRPVFAGAGAVTILTVGVALLTGLRKQDASVVAVTLLGSQGQQQ